MTRIWNGVCLLILLLPLQAWAATLSGTVTYSGNQQVGRVYLQVFGQEGYRTGHGVSIEAPGAFTIRGLSPGGYFIKGYMDNRGYHKQHAASPFGASQVFSLQAGDLTGIEIQLADPDPVPVQAPPSIDAAPGPSVALVFWELPSVGDQELEIADSYDVYWSTSPDVGPEETTGGGSRLGIPARDDGFVTIPGLVDGTALYFAVVAKAGQTASEVTRSASPVTIGAPAGEGHTVSGSVEFSLTPPENTPLLAVLQNYGSGDDDGPMYPVYYGNTTNPQQVQFTGIPAGVYGLYLILDMDKNGTISLGDVVRLEDATVVHVAGDTSFPLQTLTAVDADARVMTRHYTYSTFDKYGLSLHVAASAKMPVNVAAAGPGLDLAPIDLALSPDDDDVTFGYWQDGISRPQVGQLYTFTVQFEDATTGSISAPVTGVIDSLPNPLSPVGNVEFNPTPTFTWDPPATPPASPYFYHFRLWRFNPTGPGWDWEMWDLDENTSSVPFNVNGDAPVAELTKGTSYDWEVTVQDLHGNEGSAQSRFVSMDPPTITSFAPASATRGGMVTITGTNFGPAMFEMVAKIGDTETYIHAWTPTSVEIEVPYNAVGGVISLTTPGGTATSAIPLQVLAPVYLSVGGSGSGTVTSSPAGFNCTTPNMCMASFPIDSQITLTATPAPGSTFGGWSGEGACTGTDPCTFTVTGNNYVNGWFDISQTVRLVEPNLAFTDILSAYQSAYDWLNPTHLKAQAQQFTQDLLLNRTVRLKLDGGYNTDFSAKTGYTTVKGKVVVERGTLEVSRLVIQ